MSICFETEHTQDEILSRANAQLKALGYYTTMKRFALNAVDGRDYVIWTAVVLFLFLFVPFLVYWFTRKRNRITITVSQTYTGALYSPSGVWKGITLGPRKVVVEYEGNKATKDAQELCAKIEALA